MSKVIRQYKQTIKRKYIKAISNQLKEGTIDAGEKTAEFGMKINSIGNHRFSVVASSGTAAYILAISALLLPPNSTILFPAYTFLAGANAARFLGYNIRLVDVDEYTLCIDPEQIRIDRGVSALIFVNQNGYVGTAVERVAEICRSAHIKMIEDASQAIGLPWAGRRGDVGIYSFSSPNIISTGQGGVLVTDSRETSEIARQIRINLSFNDLLASYGLAQLNDIDNLLDKRKKIFNTYRSHLPIVDVGIESTAMIVYKSRKGAGYITQKLLEYGIESTRPYSPVNMNPMFNDNRIYVGANNLYQKLVYLPSSLDLSTATIKKICSIVKRIDFV